MKVGYTEFSYGFALTENILRESRKRSARAPVFPNLVQEAQLGFDVKIDRPGAPLFLQFKQPERMLTNNAFEIAKGRCPKLFTPFYRIALIRRDLSEQHEHLLKLECDFPGCVWYAAPCLANMPSFNDAYNTADMAKWSAFFSPRDIGPLPDDGQHTVAYRRDLDEAYFCSEPKPIRCSSFADVESKLSSSFHTEGFTNASQAAALILESVISQASASWRGRVAGMADLMLARLRSVRTPSVRSARVERATIELLVAREIARVDLGVEMMFAQPSSP